MHIKHIIYFLHDSVFSAFLTDDFGREVAGLLINTN